MKKDTIFAWTQACTDSFEKLKQCFLSEPILRNPDPSRQLALATDALLVATGAVLLQTDENGAYHPCGYLSQSFNPAVRNNASHRVIWRFSLGNTWHELAAPLWVLSAAIPI